MSEEKKRYGRVLKVFRLETEASVSVSDLGIQVQPVRADFIPLSSESLLRSAFESAGLTPEQVENALQKLTRTAKNEGFLIPIDGNGPNKTTDAPILLLQWLGTEEYKETESALRAFAGEVKIQHADVGTKTEAIAAIDSWLHGNPNAQFLFIGTHGDEDGLGPTVQNGVDWSELWSVLKNAVRPVALWLGACHSACAAKAWSPVQGYAPVNYIVGFPVRIKPAEIEKVLHKLLKMTGIDPITFVDEEIPKLRRQIPETTVVMHFIAPTKVGPVEYVDNDDFPNLVGMTLREYLKK